MYARGQQERRRGQTWIRREWRGLRLSGKRQGAAPHAKPSSSPDAEAAHKTFRHVAERMQARWPKLAAFMDVPARQRTTLHSTNTLERLNKEVKRRADLNSFHSETAYAFFEDSQIDQKW